MKFLRTLNKIKENELKILIKEKRFTSVMSFLAFLRDSRKRYISFSVILSGSESLRNTGGFLYSKLMENNENFK
jgi:hypothetical protein